MIIKNYNVISLSVLLQLSIVSSLVRAESEERYSLEEVMVTAQKRMETQQEIPAAFNVYSEDALEATDWGNVTDMADMVPSMQAVGVTKTRTTVFIRSIGTNKYDIGTEGSIGVFVDGVYIPRFSSLMQNIIDLERVEVLRGPQGTLYGRNTIGGAISLYSKDPQEEFSAELSLGIGNEDSSNFSITANGPITDSVLGYIAVVGRESGGFRTEIRSGKEDDESVRAARGKLLYFPTDEISLKLTVDYTEQEVDAFTGEIIAPSGATLFAMSPPFLAPFIPQSEVDAEIAIEAADEYKSEANTPGYTEVNAVAASFHFSWEMEDIVIESITGYRKETVDELVDNDRTRFDLIQQVTDQNSETWSEELKVSSESGGAFSMDDNLEWLAGIFLYRDAADREDLINLGIDSVAYGGIDAASPLFGLPGLAAGGPSAVNVFPPPYPLDFFVDLVTESWAVFGQGTYVMTEEWSLTLGARYSYDEKKFTYKESTPGIEALLPGDNFEFDDTIDFQSTDPKVVLEWEPEWAESLLGYVSYAQGYKSGGIQFVARREEIARQSFDKEILKAWEVGMKSRWFDEKLQFNSAIYHYDYSKQQIQQIAAVPVAGGGTVTMVVTDNAKKSILTGIEFDLQYLAMASLLLQGNYTFMDASFDEFITRDGVDLSGKTMPAAPKHSLWVSAEYSYALENAWETGFRLDYSWRDEQVFTPDGMFKEDPYGLFTLGMWLTHPDETMKFRISCSNCANTDYRPAITPLTNDSGWAATGDRRRYSLDFKYLFE